MLFKCKVCAEKDARIQDLKQQIESLQSLVIPDNSLDKIPANHLEADGVLSGMQHTITVPGAEDLFEPSTIQEERSERDRILSGTY